MQLVTGEIFRVAELPLQRKAGVLSAARSKPGVSTTKLLTGGSFLPAIATGYVRVSEALPSREIMDPNTEMIMQSNNLIWQI